ncbi:MAG: hypothetical protein LBQ16_02755 [Gracilibacteraceae bacterium]|nr:hypothetical protein [Gracilibacteraceae bacterium]
MNKQEYAGWQALTESSRNPWTEDAIFRANGRGALYYRGGKDGIYIAVTKGGILNAGTYEGAIPHIGEAAFVPMVSEQHAGFNDAMSRAMQIGGQQFLIDMFRGCDHAEAQKAAVAAYEAAVPEDSELTENVADQPLMGQRFG